LAFANQNISITFVPRGIVVLHMPDNKFSGLPPRVWSYYILT